MGSVDDIYNNNNLQYAGLIGSGRINAYKCLSDSPHPFVYLNKEEFIDLATNESSEILYTNSDYRINIELKNVWLHANNIRGTITTDDPFISFNTENIDWGDIDTSCIQSNVSEVIVEIMGGYTRTVEFELNIWGDNFPQKTYILPVQINDTVASTNLTLDLNPDEKINRYNVCKDIDHDGIDEIIVSSDLGRVFIIDDNNYVFTETNRIMKCVPTVADIDSEGNFEIIAGTFENSLNNFIYVWDNNLNLEYQFTIQNRVTNITVSDVNGDTKPDIIATIQQTSDFQGINGFAIIDITTQSIHTFSTNYFVQHNVSVSDVDNDGVEEVILIIKDELSFQTNYAIQVYDVSNTFNITQTYFVEEVNTSLSTVLCGPLVFDINEDGIDEFIFSIMQDNQEIVKVYQYGNNQILWQYEIPLALWRVPLSRNIVIGDFSQASPGYEIMLFTQRWVVLSNQGDVILNENGVFGHYQYFPLIFDSNNDNICEIYLIQDSGYFLLDQDMQSYNTLTFGDAYNRNFDGASLIQSPEGNSICLTSTFGQVYFIAQPYNANIAPVYKQHMNNPMHTGKHNLLVPQVISNYFDLKHDVYLERDVEISRDGTLICNNGIKINIDPNIIIRIYGEMICTGMTSSEVCFRGFCQSSVPNYWCGIEFYNESTSTIEYAHIKNAYIGINYIDFGNHHLLKSKFTNNTTGIGVFNSAPIFYENTIYSNQGTGIMVDHNATPFMNFEPQEVCGTNAIYNNDIGINVSQSTPVLKEGHNDFNNVSWNIRIQDNSTFSAQKNWWGSDQFEDIVNKFNQPDLIAFDPWDANANTLTFDPNEILEIAMHHFLHDEYPQAIPLFHQILDDPLESDADYISIKSLLTCYEKIDSLATYKIFVEQKISGVLTETMRKCYEEILALMNRLLEEYNNAITYYESILDTNLSFADSCYAVIDLGNTYLESNNKAIGRYLKYRPKSSSENIRNTRNLLSQLHAISELSYNNVPQLKLTLLQNYPNPFNPTTIIGFVLPKDEIVDLSIYNLKGQKVKTLINEKMKKGNNKIVWDGKDSSNNNVSSGVYFYKLTSNKSSIVKKCLLLK